MKIKKLSSLLILALFPLAISCTTFVHIPVGHDLIPEVGGKEIGGSFGFGNSMRRVFYMVPDSVKGDSSAEVMKGGDFFKDNAWELIALNSITLSLSLNFLDKFKFYTSAKGNGLQWQILGDNYLNAKKGNLALSVFAQYRQQTNTNDNLALGTPSSNLNGHMSVNTITPGVLLGYRVSDHIGLGANAFATFIDAKGNGIVDGIGTSQTLTEKTKDIGVGLQLYGGKNSFQFQLSPFLLRVEEPVRDEVSWLTYATIHLRFIF